MGEIYHGTGLRRALPMARAAAGAHSERTTFFSPPFDVTLGRQMNTKPILGPRDARAIIALAFAALFACKSEDSLILFSLTADAQAGQLASVKLSAGNVERTFSLTNGLSATPTLFGVYVSSSITGSIGVSALATPASGCVGYHATALINVPSGGSTVNVPLLLRKTDVCPLDGGTNDGGPDATGQGGSGAAGQSGAGGGSAGTGGVGGAGGQAGTAGSGQGGGGAGGHAGAGGGAGQAGGGGAGQAGGGGAGQAGSGGAGQGGMGGGQVVGVPPAFGKCTEINHDDVAACTDNCDFMTEDWGVYGVAFSPDGTVMATGANDGRVKIWNVSNQVPTPSGHVLQGGLGVVAFSPDGTMVAVGQTGAIQLWSVGAWTTPLRSLPVAKDVYGVAFSPDSTQVISVDRDADTGAGSVYVHAVSGGAALHTAAVTAAYSFAVSRVASAGSLPVAVSTSGGKVLLFALTTAGFSTVTSLPVTADGSLAEAVEFSPDGSTLVAGGDDGVVNFWTVTGGGASASKSLPTIDIIGVLNDYSEDVGALAFNAAGDALSVGAGFFGSISAYNVAAPRAKVGATYETTNVYDMVSLAYSPTAKLIAGGEVDCGCVVVCKQ